MEKKKRISWILALIGSILVWLPIAAMLFASIAGSLRSGQFRMDYLIPAELFLLVLVGGGLLLWAAFREKLLKVPLIVAFLSAVFFLFGSQGLAMLTGLADGRIGMDSNWFIVVAIMLGLYTLAVIALGVLGVLLLVRLRRTSVAG